jgi:hypothetical protein
MILTTALGTVLCEVIRSQSKFTNLNLRGVICEVKWSLSIDSCTLDGTLTTIALVARVPHTSWSYICV